MLFVKKMGGVKNITADFLVWGTMGSDTIVEDVCQAITEIGLNVDEHDPKCVFIYTCLGSAPRDKRVWLHVETDEKGRDWISPKLPID